MRWSAMNVSSDGSTTAPARVEIAGGDPLVQRQLTRLLADDGVVVVAADANLVVLIGAGEAQERIAALREASEAAPSVRFIATMPDGSPGSLLRRALRAGADGLILDADLLTALVPTVRAVSAGLLALPRALRRQVAPRPLSYREKQILGLVVRGYTNRQIADELFVAESTVKTHLSSAFDKLDTRSRAEAAALILDPEEGYGLGILPAEPAPAPQAA